MKRPSFQFYPADWTGNSNLRRCSHAEKGIWVDVLCLMHDQEEYGVIRWSMKEIAQAVGCTVSALRALVAKGVLKGSDDTLIEPFIYVPRSGRKDGEPVTLVASQAGPIWYSSRMVKDEYVRIHAGASSRFVAQNKPETEKKAAKSSTPPLTNASPSRRHGERPGEDQGDGSSSSSSSSSHSSSYEEPVEKKNKRAARAPAGLIGPLPDWLDEKAWSSWKRHRRAIRRPMSPDAEILSIGELEKLRADGYAPKTVIENAILKGWQGLYPPKDERPPRPSYRGRESVTDYNERTAAEYLGEFIDDGRTIDA